MDWMPSAIRDGILTVLFISGPIVLLAAGLGLIVGILQAATQVQEQTLGSAVKIMGVFLALIIFGFWMFTYLNRFTSSSFNRAFRLIPSLNSHPLPALNRFKGPLRSLTQKDLDINLPYDYVPPGLKDITFTRAPSGRASAVTGIIQEPDVVPVNVGETLQQELPPNVPVREAPAVGIIEQELPERAAPLVAEPVAEIQPPAAPEIAEETIAEPVVEEATQEEITQAQEAARNRAQEEAAAPAQPVQAAPAPVVATPAPAPPAAVAEEEAPAEAAPRPRRRRLPRASLGNITNRIQESIDSVKEKVE